MTDFCGNSDITKIFIVEPSGAQQILSASTLNITGDLTVDGNIINCGTGRLKIVRHRRYLFLF